MMQTVALFGEAEKGEYQTAYFCRSVSQLFDTFGQPPEDSQGIYYAIQFLMKKHQVIFFRVREEGFSTQEYWDGMRFLQKYDGIQNLSAICLPGVGTPAIIDASLPVCFNYSSFLITNESDFYDYLTEVQRKASV